MRIIVTEFMSLDGVMEEPRWTFDFDRGKEGDQFKYEELFDAESLLLGRTTYQGFAAAWPNMGGDDFGQRMNNIHKYVVSSTLADSEATWGPTTEPSYFTRRRTLVVAMSKASPPSNLRGIRPPLGGADQRSSIDTPFSTLGRTAAAA